MLTPDQLKRLPDNIVRLFQDLEDYILADIAKRLAKVGDLTDTAKIELEIARALKTPLKEIEKAIQDATKMVNEEIEQLFKANAIKSMDYEDAIYKKAGMDPGKLYQAGLIADIVNQGVKQTQGELYNLTRSLGFATAQNGKTVFKPIAAFYQDTLDDALMKVRTGAASYQDAVKQAVKKMSDSGISFVDYKTGHINRLDVASRRAVLTGANQMSLQMTDLLMDEFGAEYVETTAHSGARPDHAVWQGKVYHVGGAKDGYPDFESVTGYGTGPGLGGWNCRHNYFPYFPGISERAWTDEELKNIDPPPFEYMGETYTHYEATQIQRRMETEMRKLKREVIGHDASENKLAFENASMKLQLKKQEYRSFSSAAGLRYQLERGQVYGFSKSISSKSFHVAKASHAQWLKDIGATSTTLDNLKKFNVAKINKSLEYQLIKAYETGIIKGEINSLTGLEHFKNMTAQGNKLLLGMKTQDGVDIKEISPHFINRVLGGKGREGVPFDYVKDALLNPVKTKDTIVGGEKRRTYWGKRAKVVIDIKRGRLFQTNRISEK